MGEERMEKIAGNGHGLSLGQWEMILTHPICDLIKMKPTSSLLICQNPITIHLTFRDKNWQWYEPNQLIC